MRTNLWALAVSLWTGPDHGVLHVEVDGPAGHPEVGVDAEQVAGQLVDPLLLTTNYKTSSQ